MQNSKIQTRQNTKEQNTNCQNTNVTKNKCNKIQMEQNTYAKMPKYNTVVVGDRCNKFDQSEVSTYHRTKNNISR